MVKHFRSLFLACFLLFSITAYSDQLIIEPEMGRTPLLSAINKAHSSIQLVMYGLTDQPLINSLIAAKNKNLQIILEKNPYQAVDENKSAISALQQNAIDLHWPNPQFKLTHQKTFVFDHQQAIVMTFNLTHGTFAKERNFALITNEPATVHEIERVFLADKEHRIATVNQANLAWCPNNCREKITHLIQSAQHSIQIYAQDITDYQMTGVIANAARHGIRIQLLLTDSANRSKNKKRFQYLTRAGVDIHFNQNYIIHAKAIIIDRQRALIGSINLTKASMDDNRELSIITIDKAVIQKLTQTFTLDWME